MIENKFRCTNISENGNTGLFWLGKDNLSVYDIVRLLNELTDENEQLKSTVEEMIKIFNDSGLDYVVSDEMEEILND